MSKTKLPPLAPGIEYLGPEGRPDEKMEQGLPVLTASYRVHGLRVSIGWTVGHSLGDFRQPNELNIHFDPSDYAMGYGQEDAAPFDGITTALLRSIPMAHARALMRSRFEELSVAEVARDIMPLPKRVDSEHDYLHVATAFAALCPISFEPLQQLAKLTGESPETWSARVRRAKSRGMLEGKGRGTKITAAFQEQSNAIWTTMRARKDAE